MTEHEWETSTNPTEMVAFLGERITDEHRRFFVEGCRKEFAKVIFRPFNPLDKCHANFIHFASVPFRYFEAIVSKPLRAEILRDIVGNPFKKLPFIEDGKLCEYVTKPGFNVELAVESEWLTWNDGTIPKMVDAMLFEDCGKCGGMLRYHTVELPKFNPRWERKDPSAANMLKPTYHRCDCTNGRIPRDEPRWEMMPVIADALEEAGCHDQHILEHLRSERCPWCFNGRQGRFGYLQDCPHCNVTGWIKRRHWKGCWVVELLRGVS